MVSTKIFIKGIHTK